MSGLTSDYEDFLESENRLKNKLQKPVAGARMSYEGALICKGINGWTVQTSRNILRNPAIKNADKQTLLSTLVYIDSLAESAAFYLKTGGLELEPNDIQMPYWRADQFSEWITSWLDNLEANEPDDIELGNMHMYVDMVKEHLHKIQNELLDIILHESGMEVEV